MLLKMLLKRIGYGLIVVVGVMTVLFFILRVIPGDPSITIAPTGTLEVRLIIREELNLDKPIIVQFGIFVKDIFTGHFGKSFFMPDANILKLLFQRTLNSFKIALLALTFIIIASILLGISSASRANSFYDNFITGITLMIQSIPNFWMGLMLVLFLGVKLKLLPTTGYRGAASLVLPSFVLALSMTATFTRLVKICAIDTLSQDFILAARARGISKLRINYNYVMRNVSLYLLTIASLQFGIMIGGVVILEFVFDYPGLGLLTLNAILRRDYPVIEAIVLFIAVLFVVINIITDTIYYFIDPRVRKVIK